MELLKPDTISLSSLQQFSRSKTLLVNKEGVVYRFKHLVKDYWYIVIPVDLSTSVIWYSVILFCLKSGVNLEEVLYSLGLSKVLGEAAQVRWISCHGLLLLQRDLPHQTHCQHHAQCSPDIQISENQTRVSQDQLQYCPGCQGHRQEPQGQVQTEGCGGEDG